MNEDFINFIWRFRLFDQKKLLTTKGEPVEIISPGLYNSHAGPDFIDVKVRIGSTTWCGSAEIHIRTSDWELHGHTRDRAYNNVILHVVYENDCRVFRNDDTEPAVLVIKPLIYDNIEHRYEALIKNLNWIPCEKQIGLIEPIYIQNVLQRMLVERLEEKSQITYGFLQKSRGDWNETFYVMLARNFGFKLNALPFELLARSIPLQILEKHKNNLFQLESLFFGQAGFLDEAPKDEYTSLLQREYLFLKHKYSLKSIDSYLWKHLRLRPQNFPCIRLSQFTSLIHQFSGLFSRLTEIEDPKTIKALFNSVSATGYWQVHNKPGKASKRVSAGLGKESIDNILINTVSVILFSYGKYIDRAQYIERAINLLESIPVETNHIIKRFKNIGVKTLGADSSQALLQLKKNYCDKKKCLNCALGARIINSA